MAVAQVFGMIIMLTLWTETLKLGEEIIPHTAFAYRLRYDLIQYRCLMHARIDFHMFTLM